MDKCSLCGDKNIIYKKNEENIINLQTNENDNIHILADRLLKFEGYERLNEDYPIWICEECRKSIEHFAELLKIIRNKREKKQQEEQAENMEDVNDLRDVNHLEVELNRLKTSSNTEDLKELYNEPPLKRLRRPPKRYLDNDIYIPPKPIKIQKVQTQNYLNRSEALLPKIAEIRLSTGRVIGELREADNHNISSKFRITCAICSLVFCFEREFRKHFLKHSEEEMTNNLEVLMQSFIVEDFWYYCEICQKSFQEHFAVRRHYKQAHSQERTYQCEHCSSRFKYKFNLDYHMAKHLNQRNFQCSLCSKNFILRYELLIHQRTHTQEKPYKCQFCSISFAHRSNLVTHRRLHTQKKTFKCSRCEATFKCIKYLKKHEKNHENKIGQLLESRPECKRQELEEENYGNLPNPSVNTALPNFDTLQSTLQTARLNNYHHVNHVSSELNATISNTHHTATTDIPFHDFTFENTLSPSKPNTFQILKIPTTTTNHYHNITLSKGEVLKTPYEPKTFQIGNTTLKIIPKAKEKSSNSQNFNNNQNSPKNSKSLSSISPYLDNPENFKFSLENHKNSLISKQTHNDLMNLENFQNSSICTKSSALLKNYPNPIKVFLLDSSAINRDYNRFSNQVNLAPATDMESSQNFNVNSNLRNSPKKSTLLKTAEEMSKNLKNHENQSDYDYSHNFNDFSNLRNSPKKSTPLKLVINQEKFDGTYRNSFSNMNIENFKITTKSPNFENQENVLKTTDIDSSHNFNDFSNLKNSPKTSEEVENTTEIGSLQNFNDFYNLGNSPKKPTLLKTAEKMGNQEKLVVTCKNSSYGSFSNVLMTNFKNSTKSPIFKNPENILNTTEIDSTQKFYNFSCSRNSPNVIIANSTKSPDFKNQENILNTTEIDCLQNFSNIINLRNSPNVIITNFKNSTKSSNFENQENIQKSVYIDSSHNFNDFFNLSNSSKKSILLKTDGEKSPHIKNQVNRTEIDAKQKLNDFFIFKNSPKKSTLLKTAEEKSSHIQNQENLTEIDARQNLKDFFIFKNSPKKSKFLKTAPNQEIQILNAAEIDSLQNFNDFSNLRNSPKKSTLLKMGPNQEKFNETCINKSYGSFSKVLMTNLNNSTKTTNNTDPQNVIFPANSNFKSGSNLENLSFNNSANSTNKISLLKIKENPLLNNNSKNSLKPSICLPKINMKSFKIVKISGDYLKNKFKTATHTPLSTKECNNIRNSPEDVITQMPKLKYFTNNDKIMKNPLSISKNIKNFNDSANDLTIEKSNGNDFRTTESCLRTSTPEVANKEIFERDFPLHSGEFSKNKNETHPPLNLVTTTYIKDIKLPNTLNLSNNLGSRPKGSLNLKTLKLSHPIKLVKISKLNGSLNMSSGNNTILKSMPRDEMPKYEDSLKNSSQVKGNSSNSLCSTSIVNQTDLDFKANFNKSPSDLKFSAKPAKIINIKHLTKSSIDLKSSQNIPVHILTKSKDCETPLPQNSNSLVINTSPPAVNLKTTPVQIKLTPLHKPPANKPVMSLLKPKTTTSPTPLITNIEILAPLTTLKILQPSPSALNHPQNVVYKFQCSYCWKYFKQKASLKRHLRTHTGEKPYKCNLCPKSYADASNYKKHKIIHKKAAEALNINRPPLMSPHLPGYYHKPHLHSPTHSTASDPDPDGIEIMKTIKKFGGSSSSIDELDVDDDDIESTTSSSMESYMWQQALGYAIKNDDIRNRIIRNLAGINNSIMPSIDDPLLTNTFTGEDPD